MEKLFIDGTALIIKWPFEAQCFLDDVVMCYLFTPCIGT